MRKRNWNYKKMKMEKNGKMMKIAFFSKKMFKIVNWLIYFIGAIFK